MAIHNHTTPREYLRHFASSADADKIWRYSLHEGVWELIPVANVGQRKDFYTAEEEVRLSKIEGSAIAPLRLLRAGQQLDHEGQRAVGVYLTTMIARVEHTRKKLPSYLRSEISAMQSDIQENTDYWTEQWNLPASYMVKYLSDKHQSLTGDPLRIKDPIFSQIGVLPQVIEHITRMCWTALTSNSSDRFLTSDNPVFVRRDIGLKPPDGEFLFALSSEVGLMGSWRSPSEGLEFLKGPSGLVREFNRCVIAGADRWLYFHEKAKWVREAAKNPSTKSGRRPW